MNYFNGRESKEFDQIIEKNLRNQFNFNFGLANKDFNNFFKCKQDEESEIKKILFSA